MQGTHVQNGTERETEAQEGEAILPRRNELFSGGGELTPSSAMWLGTLSLSTHSHCPFLHKEIQRDDLPSPVTLSLFLSPPDLHIAK